MVRGAPDLRSGGEVWRDTGPVLKAGRASWAVPGLFSPVRYEQRWMLDGGLVKPVPVSACRAQGADVVIAVNLNAQLVGAHLSRGSRQQATVAKAVSEEERSLFGRVLEYFTSGDDDNPGFFDVVAASINIMQDRITRSRMAGDPSEVTLIPLLEDFALMDFHRASEAIEEGRRLVQRHAEEILGWVGTIDS